MTMNSILYFWNGNFTAKHQSNYPGKLCFVMGTSSQTSHLDRVPRTLLEAVQHAPYRLHVTSMENVFQQHNCSPFLVRDM